MVGGKAERIWSAAELFFPEVEEGIELVPREEVSLPESEVDILNGERRERRRESSGEGLVEVCELAQEDAHGPSVRDDVVQGEKENVFECGAAKDGGTEEGSMREVKGSGCVPGREREDLFLRDVEDGEGKRERVGDAL